MLSSQRSKTFLNCKALHCFSKKTDLYFLSFSAGIILLYLFSFYTNSWDILVYRHDNLDSNIVIYKLLADTKTLFSSNTAIIPNMMNGLPRAVFPGELNVVTLLYYWFEPVNAYMINEALIRFIALFGMFLLLKHHFFKDSEKTSHKISYSIMTTGTALIFSLLPYWSNAGASIAGQAFVLYAFLNLKNSDLSFKNWFILAVFTLYSSLILAGMFVLAMLSLIAIYDSVKNRRINYYLFIAILMMSILYLAVEYRLIWNMFDPVFVSHREEFVPIYLDFEQALKKSIRLFFDGQYHAHSIHGKYLLPFVLTSVFFAMLWNLKNKINHKHVLFNTVLLILLSIILISIFSGFEDFTLVQPLKESFPILKQVQFDRFYFLYALLWFLAFALSAKVLLDNTKWVMPIVITVMIMQISYSFSMQSSESWRNPVEFKRFYSSKVFSDIKRYISLPVESYRVMSIGLAPSIAAYNGFYTLDAYLPTYPMEYKHAFRKIIAPELQKSKRWQSYFDYWGSRCQLMSQEKNISLNLGQFKNMGGKYIFAAYDVNINNAKGIEFLRMFSAPGSQYDVYVYSVK